MIFEKTDSLKCLIQSTGISRKRKEREVLRAKLNENFEVAKLKKKALQESERFGISLNIVADPKKQIIKFFTGFSYDKCGIYLLSELLAFF